VISSAGESVNMSLVSLGKAPWGSGGEGGGRHSEVHPSSRKGRGSEAGPGTGSPSNKGHAGAAGHGGAMGGEETRSDEGGRWDDASRGMRRRWGVRRLRRLRGRNGVGRVVAGMVPGVGIGMKATACVQWTQARHKQKRVQRKQRSDAEMCGKCGPHNCPDPGGMRRLGDSGTEPRSKYNGQGNGTIG